jgi:lactate permease
MLYYLLALLPIIILVFVSVWKNLNLAVISSFVVTVLLFFIWQAPVNAFFASLLTALLSTLTILMIVSGAMFLYRVMEGTGYIRDINASLGQIHDARAVNFFLITIGLTAFFEGVAGFGTPGTIVPLLLIALGFNPALSVSAVLLANSITAIAGAVGTPVLTGLQIPLSLPESLVTSIYIKSGILISIAGFIVLLCILRLYRKQEGELSHTKYIFMMYAFFILPLIVFTFFASEFSVILAALCMLVLSAIVLKKSGEPLKLAPWVPYLVLIMLLLLPKILLPLQSLINREIQFRNLWSSGIDATFKPLAVPLIPFMVVGAGVMWVKKSRRSYLGDISRKVFSVCLILFPAIAVSQLMINSGAARPSMTSYLSMMLQQTGPLYTLFAPLLGITGAFITGSTTVSNIIFGASQLETAKLLVIDESVILALQLCGASLGNSICLFNIIAAATVANLQDYKQILKNNLLPAIMAGLVAGLCGMLLVYLAGMF